LEHWILPNPPIKRFTHPQRAKRRARMAMAARGGASRLEVAERFGVNEATVRAACKAAGVSVPVVRTAQRKRAERDRAIGVAADRQVRGVLVGGGKTQRTEFRAQSSSEGTGEGKSSKGKLGGGSGVCVGGGDWVFRGRGEGFLDAGWGGKLWRWGVNGEPRDCGLGVARQG
jgi:hypothetical protein